MLYMMKINWEYDFLRDCVCVCVCVCVVNIQKQRLQYVTSSILPCKAIHPLTIRPVQAIINFFPLHTHKVRGGGGLTNQGSSDSKDCITILTILDIATT